MTPRDDDVVVGADLGAPPGRTLVVPAGAGAAEPSVARDRDERSEA